MNISNGMGAQFAIEWPTVRNILSQWNAPPIAKMQIARWYFSVHTVLDLSELGLESLPEIFSFARFRYLESLDLSHNRLTALPASFALCEGLSLVDLFGNQLLNQFAMERREMERVLTAWNGLDFVKDYIRRWYESDRRDLDLSGNDLESLPPIFGFSRFRNLTSLNISNNRIRELPASLSMCTSLESFILSNNVLTSFPDSVAFLPVLQELDLEHNFIQEVPDFIFNLPAACTVYLHGNRLEEEEIQELRIAMEEEQGVNIIFIGTDNGDESTEYDLTEDDPNSMDLD